MKIRCISNKLTRFPGTDFLDYGSPPRSAQRLANCSRFVTGSLSAVSEAPMSEELGVETLYRALQIRRLEGSRPGGLWDLYLDEPVLILCEYAIAVRALGFQ